MFKFLAIVTIAIALLMVFHPHLKAEFERGSLRSAIGDLEVGEALERELLSISSRVAMGYRTGVYDTVDVRALLKLKAELKADGVSDLEARSIIGRYEVVLGRHGL